MTDAMHQRKNIALNATFPNKQNDIILLQKMNCYVLILFVRLSILTDSKIIENFIAGIKS